jgi:hypothetical protein
MVGDIISERWARSSRNWWAASSRNDGRLHPESAYRHQRSGFRGPLRFIKQRLAWRSNRNLLCGWFVFNARLNSGVFKNWLCQFLISQFSRFFYRGGHPIEALSKPSTFIQRPCSTILDVSCQRLLDALTGWVKLFNLIHLLSPVIRITRSAVTSPRCFSFKLGFFG